MTRGKSRNKGQKPSSRLLINRTISIVMLLISFLTFWSLALSSFEQNDKAQYLIRAAIVPDPGLDQLLSRN